MFFDDPGPLRKNVSLKLPPPTPETGWRPPATYPNLSRAIVVGLDVEVKETDFERGPGWARGKSHIVGFSLAARDAVGNAGKWYFPIRHEVEPEYNLDPQTSLAWLKTILSNPHTHKVGANLLYDIGTLNAEGIEVAGPLHDVQFAEAIIDTDADVGLDELGVKYAREGKLGNLLYDWCAEAYGGPATSIQRGNIWRTSPRLAGPYAEQDADLPIRIFEKQWPILQREELEEVYKLEIGLIPLLIKMRFAGVRVDIDYTERLYAELAGDVKRGYADLYELAPVKIDSVMSADQISKLFDHAGIDYPETARGTPSFRKDWLKNLDHPIANKINEIRELEKLRSTFLRNYILEGHVNGRIHCQFHPLRSPDGGAKTGRFASSDPNLQNIPARTDLGMKVRKAFVPDEGHVAWEKNDASQIEYRGLAHYAVGKGSDELRNKYINDPDTDYHKATQDNVERITGIKIERRPIKNMNFGLVYGMQEAKLGAQNGFTPEQTKAVFRAYHEGNPYVRPTMEAAAEEMQRLGYITTILGRRIRFNYWEPLLRDFGKPRQPGLPYDLALRRYGSMIKRSGEHKAINYRLQGTAADQIKMGMLRCYQAGVFDIIGVPRLQVHDELDISVIENSPRIDEAHREMRHILETAIKFKIPIKYEYKRGNSWGEID